MAINKVGFLALGAAAALGSMSAQAADKELLNMLLQNGAINQSQYNKLIKQETISKKDVNDITVKLGKKGLQFETADKEFKLKIGGRLHADATFHSGDNKLSKEATDGTEIRRARIYLKGVMWKDFKYQSEFDFADNSVGIKDLFVTYKGLDWLEITVGNQKQPISMELQESSNDIMFTERSLVNSLTHIFDRAIGLHVKSSGHDWSAQFGAYGDAIGGANKVNNNDEGWGLASRATYAPINTKNQVVHLGAYGGYRAPTETGNVYNSGKALSFSYETTHMSNLKLSNTGSITNVDDVVLAGVEAAYMHGPFSLQGEYARAWVNRDNALNTLQFDALYVQAAWTLTGESRTYKGSDGEFKRLKPAKNFSLRNGGWGAVELAARYGQNDLNADGQVPDGGSEKAVTVAVNWYLNENVRLMADYRRAFSVGGNPTPVTGPNVNDINVFTLRTQWAF